MVASVSRWLPAMRSRRAVSSVMVSILPPGPARWSVLDRATTRPRLALLAPEEVAAGEHLGRHGGAADQALLAGPAVDVDLAPVLVDARVTAHGFGSVLGVHRVDAAVADTERHELDQVVPDQVELRAAHELAGHERIDVVPVERLGAVDVADAGEDLLVHHQHADRTAGPADPDPSDLRVGVRTQRVRAEPRDRCGDLLR